CQFNNTVNSLIIQSTVYEEHSTLWALKRVYTAVQYLNVYGHRPEHKPICGAAGIPKLIKTLMANPDLLMPLGECFIIAFDLINRARCSEPLVARLDVAVEPSDIFNCAEIFLGLGEGTLRSGSKKAGKGKNYDGMLQVNTFTPITNPKPITDSHRVVWRRERATADAAGFRANEVVLMDIFHADGQMSMTIPMQISAGLKELVAEWITDGLAKPTDVDPTGKTTRDPAKHPTETLSQPAPPSVLHPALSPNKPRSVLSRPFVARVDIGVDPAAIQHFPVLLNKPRSVLSTPFVARVDIGVDPADISDFFRIFNNEPEAPHAAQLQGMFQINAFTPLELTASSKFQSTQQPHTPSTPPATGPTPYGPLPSAGMRERTLSV
ncbi:hypothetical protein B0H14DRAFT_3730740, partial [Mycena olivaceomarginata]